MTPEDIKKLPTPETDAARKDCFLPGLGGNYEGMEGVYIGVARSLEQRLAAAVIALEFYAAGNHTFTDGDYLHCDDTGEVARETIASIRSMK